MDYETLDCNRKRWNRYLLNGFWLIIFLTIILECAHLAFENTANQSFAFADYTQPILIQLLILLLAECCFKVIQGKYQDYILIFISVIIAATIVYTYHSLTYLLFAPFLPVMVSIFYFQGKKLLFALVNAISSIYILYAISPSMRTAFSYVSLITITIMFLSFSLIAWGIIMRGKEMMAHLRTSVESNQQLLVQTVVMDKLSKTDSLTELYNHMSFHEFFEKSIEQHERNRLALQLALIDIDNFKHINDAYGHRAGDAVLQWVSKTIQSLASPNDFSARYGGEEFAVLFTDKSLEDAYEIVERMRKTISGQHHEVLGGKPVTVSIGIAPYNSGEGKEIFFNRVDEALYKAKNSGKNKTVLAAGPFESRLA
ncbi:GGDEF domain-containing protein [Paenibacillus sp. GCM10027626]|uniref:GGDEF domain-containing protein n=1 Tax=Paenibacillus sp. GCM10027626 TaxID=3273411 RepID=UPI00362925CB